MLESSLLPLASAAIVLSIKGDRNWTRGEIIRLAVPGWHLSGTRILESGVRLGKRNVEPD